MGWGGAGVGISYTTLGMSGYTGAKIEACPLPTQHTPSPPPGLAATLQLASS